MEQKFKYLSFLFISIFLISLVQAETSFFENPDDVFIFENPQQITGGGGTGGSGGTAGNITSIEQTFSTILKDYSVIFIILGLILIGFLIFLYRRRKKRK